MRALSPGVVAPHPRIVGSDSRILASHTHTLDPPPKAVSAANP